jgi:hypothetical protein
VHHWRVPPDPLTPAIHRAADALGAAIARELPTLAPRALGWLRALTTTGRPADYFLHPRRFPVVRLPWWSVEDRPPDPALLDDVVRGTMAGYWYVRLVDDLVDREPRTPVEVLPLAAFLHLEFEGAWRRHFPAESPFWPVFRARWLALADSTAPAADDPGPDALVARAAATIGAVVIPIRALTLAAGVPARFGPWAAAAEALARAEQLLDDLTDWHTDHERGQPNVLVALGAREVGHAAVPGWVAREGFRRGLGLAAAALDRAAPLVAALGSEGLDGFLAARRAALAELAADTAAGLDALEALARAFPGPSA